MPIAKEFVPLLKNDMICDNINHCHDNIQITETDDGLRVICKVCKQINILRKDRYSRFNNRQYSKVFKRDILQPGTNLYYKVNGDKMSVV